MTNYEKIKSMSAEEMAEFMYKFQSDICAYCGSCESDFKCWHGFKKWLESEAVEN